MKYALLKDNVVIQIQPNKEKGFIEVEDDVICGMIKTEAGFIIPEVVKTAEEILAEWKIERGNAVKNIIVTHGGIEYQGDEDSQNRINRAILGLTALNTQTGVENTVPWTANDNSVHQLTVADLSTILLLAGQAQSALWNEGRP